MKIPEEGQREIRAAVRESDQRQLDLALAKVHQMMFGLVYMVIGVALMATAHYYASGAGLAAFIAAGLMIAFSGAFIFDRARPWREPWGLLRRIYRHKPKSETT